MGNTNYESKNIQIYIQTEKLFFNCGSSIEGAVFVDVAENSKFDALYLRIEGKEWCQWFEGSSANRSKFVGSDDFYAMEYLLEKYEDQYLAKGNYAYPFSIELSQNLPGSFESSNYDAKIEYKLEAYFVNYKNGKRQTCTIPLLVRQPFRQEVVSYQGTTATNPVTCFCFSQGEVLLEAHFQRNVCFEGETIKVDFTVDNSQGKMNISGVEVRLVQYTFVCANNGVYRTYKKLIKKHVMGKGVAKREKRSFSHPMTIPNVPHQTAISTLVANYYRIQVTALLGTFTTELPSIYAPLFVLKKSFSFKNPKAKHIPSKTTNHKLTKPVVFRAPDYWFRKNRNLSVMNFRFQDVISASYSELNN